jgi:hypothetical protein
MSNEKTYRNHTITIGDDWTFSVIGPEFDNKGHTIRFNSFQSAREEIEKRVDETAKVDAQNITMGVTLIGLDGEVKRFNRINRRSGNLDPDIGKFYPNLPPVASLIGELAGLNHRAKEISSFLSKIEINNSRAYQTISADDYARKVAALKQEVAEKTQIARDLFTPKEVEKEETAQETA